MSLKNLLKPGQLYAMDEQRAGEKSKILSYVIISSVSESETNVHVRGIDGQQWILHAAPEDEENAKKATFLQKATFNGHNCEYTITLTGAPDRICTLYRILDEEITSFDVKENFLGLKENTPYVFVTKDWEGMVHVHRGLTLVLDTEHELTMISSDGYHRNIRKKDIVHLLTEWTSTIPQDKLKEDWTPVACMIASRPGEFIEVYEENSVPIFGTLQDEKNQCIRLTGGEASKTLALLWARGTDGEGATVDVTTDMARQTIKMLQKFVDSVEDAEAIVNETQRDRVLSEFIKKYDTVVDQNDGATPTAEELGLTIRPSNQLNPKTPKGLSKLISPKLSKRIRSNDDKF